jgi:putative membrane protein
MTNAAKIRRLALYLLGALYLVFWLGGAGQYVFLGGVAPGQEWAASFFLFLTGLILLVAAPSRRHLARLLLVALIGFGLETIGSRYGFLFGDYAYTALLQPQLGGVPLAMASAWMALVAYTRQMLNGAKSPLWQLLLTGALWLTVIDLVIDPLAANRLGYWKWAASGFYYGIPTHNFAGWFVSGLLINAVLGRAWEPSRAELWLGLSLILFFTLIAFANGLFIAGLVGAGLCLFHFLQQHKHAY